MPDTLLGALKVDVFNHEHDVQFLTAKGEHILPAEDNKSRVWRCSRSLW